MLCIQEDLGSNLGLQISFLPDVSGDFLSPSIQMAG
jgi:hypothetical protein